MEKNEAEGRSVIAIAIAVRAEHALESFLLSSYGNVYFYLFLGVQRKMINRETK